MEDGVWRTISGRRIFIKEGQSVSEAMKSSGKFEDGEKTEEMSFVDFQKKYADVSTHVSLGRDITISEKNKRPETLRYKDLKNKLAKHEDASFSSVKGAIDRHTRSVEEAGFKVISQTTFEKDDPVYQRVLFYAKRK